MVTIEFIEQFLCHDGAQYNPGERATVSETVARQAIRLHCARPYIAEDAKHLAGPTAHKQIKRALATK